MKTFNEKILTLTQENATLEKLQDIIKDYNQAILDNEKVEIIDFSKVENVKSIINANYENTFITHYVLLAKQDKKQAINNLLKSFNFKQIAVKLEENNTISINELDASKEELVKLFDFSKLEHAFQLANSVETDQKGNAKPNKSVTIFGALRIYGLTVNFINNLIGETIDKKDLDFYKVKLENIVVGDEKIFDENDNRAFIPNDKGTFSNNQLESQLNIIVRLMGFENVKLLKRDIKILKLLVLKIKQSNKTATHQIKQVNTLKFLNHIFARIKEYLNTTK